MGPAGGSTLWGRKSRGGGSLLVVVVVLKIGSVWRNYVHRTQVATVGNTMTAGVLVICHP